MTGQLLFDEEQDALRTESVPEPNVLTIDIDGWEGPLDLLLALARNQKVDLRQLSILALVEQYLVFIDEARALKLELAADYLVMAAWLAYLKSALLLPKDPTIDPSPEELALRLQLDTKLSKSDLNLVHNFIQSDPTVIQKWCNSETTSGPTVVQQGSNNGPNT